MKNTLPADFILLEPSTESEFDAYFRLRYEVLRKPWGQAAGSEADPTDSTSIHTLILHGKRAAGVCRLHFNHAEEAQIRYMGVDESFRGKGLGTAMLNYLETKARQRGARRIMLHARENAIPFYRKQGYEMTGKSYLLFDTIQHFKMEKEIK